jgi:putative transposase
MPEDFSERRQRLMTRICALPADRLPLVETFLTGLECGVGDWPRDPAGADDNQPLETATMGSPSGELLRSKDWPHAPLHRISEHGTYIVTGATLHKEHFFRGAERLNLLESALLRRTRESGWQLEAWAVFSNHYHFVGFRRPGGEELRAVLKQLHGETAHDLNLLDGVAGRGVWFNFWDTQLTFEKSYLARLNYVHQNAVRHRLALVANQYPWCSAAWFERTATRAQVSTIYSFKTDTVKLRDDYDPV